MGFGGEVHVEEGFQHRQFPVNENDSSWKRRRVGYVEVSPSSKPGSQTYLFCIRDTGEQLEVGMDWSSKPVQDTALDYKDINDYTDNEFDTWEDAITHLEETDNMRKIARTYLNDKSTTFLSTKKHSQDEDEIKMTYQNLF